MANILNHTIPLRRDFIKVPKHRRAKRAIRFIKKYVKRHSKREDISIGNELNKHIWKNGMKNPPGKVSVEILLDGDVARVNLPGLHTSEEESPKEDKTSKKQKEEKDSQTEKKKSTENTETKTDLKKPNSNNTKKEMMEYLDAKNVDYKKSMLKDEIYELVKKN